VTLTSTTPSICAVSGSTVTFQLIRPGICTLSANQAGDTTYAAAPTVSNTFKLVAANAKAGKDTYNKPVINGQSCATCHGVLPGAKLSPLILKAANADLVLSIAINNNTGGMEVLKDLYNQTEIRDIAAYLATPGI
jgi:mono/diheme cytochrome c family protein